MHKHSMKVIVGIMKGDGVLVLDKKTIFMPGTTKGEIERLFNTACMNIDIAEKFEKGNWKVTSKFVDGQRYQWYVNTEGVITSFFPTNQLK